MCAQRDENVKEILKEVTKASKDNIKLSALKGSTEGTSSANSICAEDNHDVNG